MAIAVTCSSCNRSLSFPPEAAGKTGVCPTCKTRLSIPSLKGPEPLVIDGRYEVLGELGKGAFGIVYKALDRKMKREVAIKMLLDAVLASEDSVQRFQVEAKVASQIVHPHVLQALDFGQHQNNHYIVFPFVDGKTLKELIPSGGFADPKQAVRFAVTVVEALHYVYAKHKILHRDIKPANLMQVAGDENALYLMDFGLAVVHDLDQTRLTVSGTVMGTPAYMPPEQARGDLRAVGHPSDLYSSAALLFHMLTGRVPFPGRWPAVVTEILSAPPPSASSIRKDLDPNLDRILQTALAKDPAHRYQTGKQFAEALNSWLTANLSTRVVGPRILTAQPVVATPAATPGSIHTLLPAPPEKAPTGSLSSIVDTTTVNTPQANPAAVPSSGLPMVNRGSNAGRPPSSVPPNRPTPLPPPPAPPPPVFVAPSPPTYVPPPPPAPLPEVPVNQTKIIVIAVIGLMTLGLVVGGAVLMFSGGKGGDDKQTAPTNINRQKKDWTG